MEGKGKEPIVVRQIRVPEVHVEPVELWLEVALFIHVQRCAKIDVKVLEAHLNLALIRKPYRVS